MPSLRYGTRLYNIDIRTDWAVDVLKLQTSISEQTHFLIEMSEIADW